MKLILIFSIIKFEACFLWLTVLADEEKKDGANSESNSTTNSKFFISQDKMIWHDAKKVKKKLSQGQEKSILKKILPKENII